MRDLQQLRNNQQISALCRQADIAVLWAFGSRVRGEADADSDLDLLVRFSQPKSLLALVRLERALSQALNVQVDLVTENSLSPYLKDSVLQNRQIIYEA